MKVKWKARVLTQFSEQQESFQAVHKHSEPHLLSFQKSASRWMNPSGQILSITEIQIKDINQAVGHASKCTSMNLLAYKQHFRNNPILIGKSQNKILIWSNGLIPKLKTKLKFKLSQAWAGFSRNL